MAAHLAKEVFSHYKITKAILQVTSFAGSVHLQVEKAKPSCAQKIVPHFILYQMEIFRPVSVLNTITMELV